MRKFAYFGLTSIFLISCCSKKSSISEEIRTVRVTSPNGSLLIENKTSEPGLSVEKLAGLAFGEDNSYNIATFSISDVVDSTSKSTSNKMELKSEHWDIYVIKDGGSVYFYTWHE